MRVLGIDVGGTGIKGARVETESGLLLDEHFRLLTPHPAIPEDVTKCVVEIVRHFDWHGPIGCGMPSVVKKGVIMTAANIDQSWIGTDAKLLFERESGCPVTIINDADAAGLAEMEWGAGKGHNGVVLMVTLGTGIGSALFVDGKLLPNTELGHVEIRGKDAEARASDHVRQEKELSWKQWAKRVDRYLTYMERLFWPDLIIVGGGASKHSTRFIPYLSVHAQVVAAQLLNDAGIAGAALAVEHHTV